MRKLFYCLGVVATLYAGHPNPLRAEDAKDDSHVPINVDTTALGPAQRELWANIDVYAQYVSETELEQLPTFEHLAPKRNPSSEPDPRRPEGYGYPTYRDDFSNAGPFKPTPAIYLLMLCRRRENARLQEFQAKAAVVFDGIQCSPFTIVPPSNLCRSQVYLLIYVGDNDHGLFDAKVQAILRSRPEIIINSCSMK